MKKTIDFSKKYGYLSVFDEYVIRNERKKYLCVCRCGNKKHIDMYSLISGVTVSCGCYNLEKSHFKKHGMIKTRIYNIHSNMIERCTNVNSPNYKNYGGRGISVCKEWTSFTSFYNDMHIGYADSLSLDRIDNEGGYCKENCRWSTRKEQSRNTRKNVKYKGECAVDAGIRLGGGDHLVIDRVLRGWSLERAFSVKIKKHKTDKDVLFCL